MIYIVYPDDPSTAFLEPIVISLQSSGVELDIITVGASDDSYERACEAINDISGSIFTMFMGHGTDDELLGGESSDFKRKAFIKKSKMNIFKGHNLLLLSCDSEGLIKNSRRTAGFSSTLSFGALPTSYQEVENSQKLKKLGLTERSIKEFKEILVELVVNAVRYSLEKDSSLETVYNYLKLLINIEINRLVLKESNSTLANLLFQVKQEMTYC